VIKKLIQQVRYVKNIGQVYNLLNSKIKSMELAITYNCNFRCPGCYAADLKESVLLTKEQILTIVKKYKPAHINITGGEPLLHPELFEIIKSIPKNIIVSMVTNGSLLSFNKINKLIEAGLNTIQISYGANYPMRTNEHWAFIAKSNGLNVCLSVTNTYKNKPYIIRAINIAKKYGYHVLWNLPMGDLEKDFDKETYFKYRNEPFVREDNMFFGFSMFENLLNIFKKRVAKCAAGTKKIYITAKGELMPCDRLHEVYESYEEMSKVYKAKPKVWCNRLGDIK